MPKTRAKFFCSSVTLHSSDPSHGKSVKLHPVNSGSEENKEFWKYTPAGEITMTISNPDAAKMFEPGKEFYVDFTPAE
ncbi:hypothetical protein [Deinococcus sp. QL22]|uniref:hypothetical protein n=1 Tax=Deinococcus sp. QL22 TaxID=2939437 RepID=UPI002016D98C|nr:hypothetical protein [Deinococcus sp. QL22]UQN10383.1 hypothetical protein M1R55_29975 [Deinococcus sp. QL22]UQN10517.1 hypothetical protein M1R55_29300 [Deinococcus sp. QL22]